MARRASMGLLLAGAVLSILAVRLPPAASGPAPAREDVPAPSLPLFRGDPARVPPSWLLGRLELPEPFSSRAAAAGDDREAFEAVLRSYFLARPGLNGLPDPGLQRTLEDYRQGILHLSPNPPVPFVLPLDWGTEGLGANFLSQLHSLRFLPPLMDAVRTSGDPELFRVVEAVWLDWTAKNPPGAPMHARAWHEGSVARRIRVLLDLLNLYKDTGGPRSASLALLLSSLCQHAEFLASDDHYETGSNHGLRQDWGLLAAALAVPEFRRSGEWTAIALTRMREKQVGIGFSEEGVSREHSPAYHAYVVRMINHVGSLLRRNGYAGDLSWIDDLNRRSHRYLTHVLTPAGRFPPVGDSSETELGRSSARADPALMYAATSGARGRAPEALDGFFPDAGQAILRDTWGADPAEAARAVYVHLHAANHLAMCPVHRHADELSFVLHARGRWWILEAGKYAYDRDRWRDYVLSARAHNGYTLDGQALPPHRRTAMEKDVWLEPVGVSTPEIAAARAHTLRFATPGARADRTLVLLRRRRTLVLLDRLQAPGTGRWEGTLHLAPDLQVRVDGLTARARAPGPEGAELEIVAEPGGTRGVTCVTGQVDPPLGWYSPSYGKLVPAPTLVFDRSGRDVVAATLVRVRGPGEPAVRGLGVRREDGACTLSWQEGRERVVLVVEDGSPLRVRLAEGAAGRAPEGQTRQPARGIPGP